MQHDADKQVRLAGLAEERDGEGGESDESPMLTFAMSTMTLSAATASPMLPMSAYTTPTLGETIQAEADSRGQHETDGWMDGPTGRLVDTGTRADLMSSSCVGS